MLHGQPWSLVEELAFQASSGQRRESHLCVGLLFFFFPPMSFNLLLASAEPCEVVTLCWSSWGVSCDTHRLWSQPVGYVLDLMAEMPVHAQGPELRAELGPERSEVLLRVAERQQGLLGSGHLWMLKVEGWLRFRDSDQLIWSLGAQWN